MLRSPESKSYRDELSDKLQVIRRSDPENPKQARAKARGYLEAKQETKEYQREKLGHLETIKEKQPSMIEKRKQEVIDSLTKGNIREAKNIAIRYEVSDDFIASPEIKQIAQIELMKRLREATKENEFINPEKIIDFAFFNVEVTIEAKMLAIEMISSCFGHGKIDSAKFIKELFSIKSEDILIYKNKNRLLEIFEGNFEVKNYYFSNFERALNIIEMASEELGFNEVQKKGLIEKVIKRLLESKFFSGDSGDKIQVIINIIDKYKIENEFIKSSEVQELAIDILKIFLNSSDFQTIEDIINKFKISANVLKRLVFDEKEQENRLTESRKHLGNLDNIHGLTAMDLLEKNEKGQPALLVSGLEREVRHNEYLLDHYKKINKILLKSRTFE